jgi:hypothetical protein
MMLAKKVPMTIVTAADNGVVWIIFLLFQRCPRPFLLSSLLLLLLRGDGVVSLRLEAAVTFS